MSVGPASMKSVTGSYEERHLDPITHQPFSKAVVLQCGHSFSKIKQLEEWIEKKETCPYCQKKVSTRTPFAADDLRSYREIDKAIRSLIEESENLKKENEELRDLNNNLTQGVESKSVICKLFEGFKDLWHQLIDLLFG